VLPIVQLHSYIQGVDTVRTRAVPSLHRSTERSDLSGTERLGGEPLSRPVERGRAQPVDHVILRSVRNAARSSSAKSPGSSQAAKWPPLSTSLK
jgi:hypothetical protein